MQGGDVLLMKPISPGLFFRLRNGDVSAKRGGVISGCLMWGLAFKLGSVTAPVPEPRLQGNFERNRLIEFGISGEVNEQRTAKGGFDPCGIGF